MSEDEKNEVFTQMRIAIARLEAATTVKFDGMNKALELQSKEYSRRLESLNGEAEHLRKMQATYVPRETYDNAHGELNKKVDELQAFKEHSQGENSRAVLVSIIAAVVAAASVIVDLIK